MGLLVTKNGRIHYFDGSSIPGVCTSNETAFERNGKWSNSTFTVVFHETTVLVSWMQDLDTGKSFPQRTWKDALSWLQEKAPAATQRGFEHYVRSKLPKLADRWDAVDCA